jgi:hypothetical protein
VNGVGRVLGVGLVGQLLLLTGGVLMFKLGPVLPSGIELSWPRAVFLAADRAVGGGLMPAFLPPGTLTPLGRTTSAALALLGGGLGTLIGGWLVALRMQQKPGVFFKLSCFGVGGAVGLLRNSEIYLELAVLGVVPLVVAAMVVPFGGRVTRWAAVTWAAALVCLGSAAFLIVGGEMPESVATAGDALVIGNDPAGAMQHRIGQWFTLVLTLCGGTIGMLGVFVPLVFLASGARRAAVGATTGLIVMALFFQSVLLITEPQLSFVAIAQLTASSLTGSAASIAPPAVSDPGLYLLATARVGARVLGLGLLAWPVLWREPHRQVALSAGSSRR